MATVHQPARDAGRRPTRRSTAAGGEPVSVVHSTAEYFPYARTGGLAEAVSGLASFQRAAGLNVVAILPLYRTVRDVEPDLEPVGPPFLVPMGGRTEEARIFRAARPRPGPAGLLHRAPRATSTGRASTARTPSTIPTTRAGSRSSRCAALDGPAAAGDGPGAAARARLAHGAAPVYLRTTLGAASASRRRHDRAVGAQPGLPGPLSRRTSMPDDRAAVGDVQLAPARVVRQDELPEGRPGLRRLRHHGEPDAGRRAAHAGRRLRAARRVHRAGRPVRGHPQRHRPARRGTRPPTRRSPRSTRPRHLEGKRRCKAALQRSFGLPQRRKVPLFGMTGRLVTQKGLDLILGSGRAARRSTRSSSSSAAASSATRQALVELALVGARPDRRAARLHRPAGAPAHGRAPTCSSCRRCTSRAASPRCGRSATARRRSSGDVGGLADTVEDERHRLLVRGRTRRRPSQEAAFRALDRLRRPARVAGAWCAAAWRATSAGSARCATYLDVYRRALATAGVR